MSKNALKTAALLGFLTAILLIGGQAIAGRQGLYMALAITAVMNFVSYFYSDKIALMSYSAQPVTETENADAYRRVEPIVRNLAQRMGLPMPKLWLIPDDSPNAFATGRNPAHASVAFTAGILRLMSRQRTRRCDRARAGPRAASRYSDQFGGRDDRRYHHLPGAYGLLVRRQP